MPGASLPDTSRIPAHRAPPSQNSEASMEQSCPPHELSAFYYASGLCRGTALHRYDLWLR